VNNGALAYLVHFFSFLYVDALAIDLFLLFAFDSGLWLPGVFLLLLDSVLWLSGVIFSKI
jgi:hypothetical protein